MPAHHTINHRETDDKISAGGCSIPPVADGSVDKLFAALLGRKKLSAEQIQKLRQIVEDLE